MKLTSVVVLLGLLAGCAPLAAPTNTQAVQELRVLDSWDAVYVKGQRICMSSGLEIERNQDAAHTFTCRRPTGERIDVLTKDGPLYRSITFMGRPAHDVSDLVAAYKRQAW